METIKTYRDENGVQGRSQVVVKNSNKGKLELWRKIRKFELNLINLQQKNYKINYTKKFKMNSSTYYFVEN